MVDGDEGNAIKDAKASLEFPRVLVGGVVPVFIAMPAVAVALPTPGRNSVKMCEYLES